MNSDSRGTDYAKNYWVLSSMIMFRMIRKDVIFKSILKWISLIQAFSKLELFCAFCMQREEFKIFVNLGLYFTERRPLLNASIY